MTNSTFVTKTNIPCRVLHSNTTNLWRQIFFGENVVAIGFFKHYEIEVLKMIHLSFFRAT